MESGIRQTTKTGSQIKILIAFAIRPRDQHLGKNMKSVTKKDSSLRPVMIIFSAYPRSIRFAQNARFLNSFSEEFVRKSLSALPLVTFGCSAQRLFRFSRRFGRVLIVFFTLVGSKIVG